MSDTWARRVTVVAPRARVDVALPVQSTLAELVPQLLRMTGGEDPAANAAWGLARLGGGSLEPGLTVGAAGLQDGDVVYLRPRERTRVPMLFDDVVDAIAEAADTGTWAPVSARRAAVAAATVAFVGAALLLAARGGTDLVSALSCGGLAVALLAGAAALARSYGDVPAATACALGAGVAGFLAGATSVAHPHGWAPTAGPVAVGLAAVTAVAVAAGFLVAGRVAVFTALVVASGGGALVCGVAVLADVRTVAACAVAVPLATALCAVAPMLSLRLARLPLPRVPTDVEAFRTGDDVALDPAVVARSVVAEQLLTALLVGAGAVVVGSAALLLHDGSRWSWALAGVGGLGWVLRSRSYAGPAARAAVLLAGVLPLVGLGARAAVSSTPEVLGGVTALVALIGVGCVAYAGRITRDRTSPYLVRLLDLTEVFALLGLLPLAAAVLGVYHAARGI